MSKNKYELRKQIRSVRWMIFWVVLAQFAAEIAVEAIISFMARPPHEYIRVALVEILAIGVPIIMYARTVWTSSTETAKKEFWLNPCRLDLLILAAFLGICGQFVMILLNMPAKLYTQMVLNQVNEETIPMAVSAWEVVFGIFAVVIIPAVLEEFWMRGIIFSAYNKSNTYAAILFTSLIFAFLHMRINEVFGLLFMGIVASVVLIKCRSIYAAMVYHGFSNLTALLFGGFILPKVLDYIWVVFSVSVLGFILFFAMILMQKTRVEVNRNFRAGGLVLNSVFSAPIILSVVIVILKYLLINVIG